MHIRHECDLATLSLCFTGVEIAWRDGEAVGIARSWNSIIVFAMVCISLHSAIWH
jgi:hypothetical protein